MSKIEWTEETWNPVTGCTKISAGCKYCYAEVMARRLHAMGTPGYENKFKLTLQPSRLLDPIYKKKPTIYFVNSMSDLFHEDVPFEFIDKIVKTIEETPQHKYQILTKRPEVMFKYFFKKKIPDNIWLGTTVENKKDGLPRLEYLREMKSTIRFVSAEPLLEDLGKINLKNIDWVIVGGESGAKARPMQEEWVINIKKQCDKKNIKFFFKQWGTWGADNKKRSKQANGRLLFNEVWDAMPNVA